MNRMDEFKLLQQEASQMPQELDGSINRVKQRAKRHRTARRLFGIPVTSVAAVFVVFVLLVNIYTPFASACSSIPALRQLMQAVSFNPSLQAALEHDFAQPVVASQTIGDFTVTVDAIVADKAQVNVFYHIDCENYDHISSYASFYHADGSDLSEVFVSSYGYVAPGESTYATIDFGQDQVPPQTLQCEIHLESVSKANFAPSIELDPEEYTFLFELTLNEYNTTQGESYDLNQWIELDGQRILVKTVEIYPTHIRIYLDDDERNTAWLTNLTCTIKDEHGNEAGGIQNGLSATGSLVDNTSFALHYESTFFWESNHLTLEISGATWLDKTMQYSTFDLSTGKADAALPPSIHYATALLSDGDLHVISIGPEKLWDPRIDMCHVVMRNDSDSFPTAYSNLYQDLVPEGVTVSIPDGYKGSHIVIEDYPYDDYVKVEWILSRKTVFTTPVTLSLK